MGWLFTHRDKIPGQSLADWFVEKGALLWSGCEPWEYKVLDSATVKFNTFYAAIERKNTETGERHVFAVIFLLRHVPKEHHNFGYKDMSEDMGPCEDDCPERILKLLTPTDSEYANDWRRRCWAKIEARKSRPTIVPGTVLRYGGRDYKVQACLGRRGYAVVHNGYEYRMKRTQAAKAEIVSAGASHG